MAMLEVNNLEVAFDTPDGTLQAVRGLSYQLEAGQTLGIVGESGAGKSQGVFALMGLLPDNARVNGEVIFEGEPLLNLPEKRMNQIRAARIGMIFQDPMTSLNPFMKVSDQLIEVLVQHKGISRKQALQESLQMLEAVRIPEARNRIHCYPHEFSGGMRQRVMIAMSLLCRPRLLIADEAEVQVLLRVVHAPKIPTYNVVGTLPPAARMASLACSIIAATPGPSH